MSAESTEIMVQEASPPAELSELEWLLKVDVKTSLEHLIQILTDCSANLNSKTPSQNNLSFQGQNQVDTIKVNATLEDFRITSADINIKLSSKHPMQIIKTCIKESANNPYCWRLHQIQDAKNHLNNAMDLLRVSPSYSSSSSPPSQDNNNPNNGPLGPAEMQSAEVVLQLIRDVMNSLLKSRSSLLIPKKSSVEELQHCQNMQSISPALPLDYTISFYVQGNNLICSVYHLAQSNNRAQIKNEYSAEVSIPFLSDVLILLGLGLQVCQQTINKIQTAQGEV